MNLAKLRGYCQGLEGAKLFNIGGKQQTLQCYVRNLDIFKNLLQMQKYGKFGNANIYNAKDWYDVTTKTNSDGI